MLPASLALDLDQLKQTRGDRSASTLLHSLHNPAHAVTADTSPTP